VTGRQPEMDAEGTTALATPKQKLALQLQGLCQEMSERLLHETEGQPWPWAAQKRF
jgi:hypothetical protein